MYSYIKYCVTLLLVCAFSFVDAQVVYQETYTGPMNPSVNNANWNAFRAALIPRAYNKMRVVIDGVPKDSITNPAIVQDMALKMRTLPVPSTPTTTWVNGSDTWYVGDCGNGMEFGMANPSSTVSPCLCSVLRCIRSGCGSCGSNYGGWNLSAGSTCPGPSSITFRVEFWFGYPCTDTPKSSVYGPKIVCYGKPFELKPDSFYADASYKWEYSTNGTSWSNFTGSMGPIAQISDSITATKWYRCTITCDSNKALTYTTPPHKVSLAPFYYCYCDNMNTVASGVGIGNVKLISDQSKDTILQFGNAAPLYNNKDAEAVYSSHHDSVAWPCMYRDSSYTLVVTQIHSTSTFKTGVVQAYLDVNRDGTYDPLKERIFIKAVDGTSNPKEVTIVQQSAQMPTIPGNAEIGPTGLRIILSADTVQGPPCDTVSGEGEIEDYIVEICHRPCDAPVNAGIVLSTDTSMCTDYEYTLTDTTYEKKRSALTWNWQVSGDNISWFDVNSSTEKDTLERVFFGQPLYYRVRAVCLPTDDTTYSDATLVNIKPGYKCYCYSKATGGLFGDSSDIGGITIAGFTSNSGGPHLLNPKAHKSRTDYTDITPVEIFVDSTYKFDVFHTMPVVEHGDAKITVFMDFNNNHEYDIPSERVYTGFTSIGNHTVVDNITIPQTAITDVPTGMRFILNNDVGPNVPSDSACGGYESGETEDFIIVFRKKFPEGIGTVSGLTGFGIHPNPSNGKFHVEFNTPADYKEVNVRVTSVTGQVVFAEAYEHTGGTFDKEVNLSQQPSGVYYVELVADGQRLIQKLIIQ